MAKNRTLKYGKFCHSVINFSNGFECNNKIENFLLAMNYIWGNFNAGGNFLQLAGAMLWHIENLNMNGDYAANWKKTSALCFRE